MNIVEPAEEKPASSAVTRCRSFLENVRNQPLWVRLLGATLWTAVAIALRFVLQPRIGERLSYDFPVVFILIVAWSFGAGPALFALAASFSVTSLLFPPSPSVVGDPGMEIWELAHLLAPVLVGVVIIESLHRRRQRLADERAVLNEEVRLHRQAEKELANAREDLRIYSEGLERTVRMRTEELQEAVQFQRDFSYVIAHDLRAPVRAIIGFTDILADKRHEPFTATDWDFLDRTREAGRRMNRMVESLVELGRVANAAVRFQQVDLDRLVARVLARFQPDLGNSSVFFVESPLGSAWTDAEMVQCVLLELVENALHFARDGVPPRIHIRTRTTGNTITLCVCDNGVGIAKAYHKQIFGCFQTLHKQEPQHPGAGLAIAAEAAARIHAIVRLDSEINEGSCFQIDLPRNAPSTPLTALPEMTQMPQATLELPTKGTEDRSAMTSRICPAA